MTLKGKAEAVVEDGVEGGVKGGSDAGVEIGAGAGVGIGAEAEGEVVAEVKIETGVKAGVEGAAEAVAKIGVKGADGRAVSAVAGALAVAWIVTLAARCMALDPAICACRGMTVNSALWASAPSVRTVTRIEPGRVIQSAGITAVSSVSLLYSVFSAAPPHSTIDAEVKLEPWTVSVKSPPPANAVSGVRRAIEGDSAGATIPAKAITTPKIACNQRLNQRVLSISAPPLRRAKNLPRPRQAKNPFE